MRTFEAPSSVAGAASAETGGRRARFSMRGPAPLFWVVLALTANVLASCQKGERVFVNAKVFALDPDQYLGVLVSVKGRVTREGPAQAWFEMEDDTGKLLVSSERLSARAGCRQGASVAVEGVLRRVSGAEGLYFSMENLLHCRP